MRARCALQKAQGSEHASRFLSIVDHDVKRIRREPLAWATPVATLLGASAAFCDGRPDMAATGLQRAADEFARADMHLYVAAARRRLGALVGGTGGRDMIRSADDWMAAQQIKNPIAMVRLLAPGFPD